MTPAPSTDAESASGLAPASALVIQATNDYASATAIPSASDHEVGTSPPDGTDIVDPSSCEEHSAQTQQVSLLDTALQKLKLNPKEFDSVLSQGQSTLKAIGKRLNQLASKAADSEPGKSFQASVEAAEKAFQLSEALTVEKWSDPVNIMDWGNHADGRRPHQTVESYWEKTLSAADLQERGNLLKLQSQYTAVALKVASILQEHKSSSSQPLSGVPESLDRGISRYIYRTVAPVVMEDPGVLTKLRSQFTNYLNRAARANPSHLPLWLSASVADTGPEDLAIGHHVFSNLDVAAKSLKSDAKLSRKCSFVAVVHATTDCNSSKDEH
jgi:hypothetical protein